MAKPKPKAKQTPQPKQAQLPYGQVGPQTYEAVRKVVEAKDIPLVRAFEEVAKATGRKASTVAVTYYSISRKKGGGRRGGRRSANGRRQGTAGSGKSIASQVSSAFAAIERIIAEQAKEIERLKSESQLADRIRKALRE